MLTYDPPVDDFSFLLEAFDYERVAEEAGFEGYDQNMMEAMLEQSGDFFSDVVLPTNEIGDQEGLEYDPDTQTVTTPDEFKDVYNQLCEKGFVGITADEEYGGAGAPQTLGIFMTELFSATNKSLAMFALLEEGLITALEKKGTEAQKDYFLPKLATGEWGGTMALTEPHCGTDLGLMRTKAEPIEDEDNAYRISGNKIWITSGEHDLTDNIVHFVLARLPDAPEGTKGISVFLVPKKLENGERNDVYCTGLEHKMGIHGSPTCEMKFDGAKGYMVGEPNKGMRTMFVMMNRARIKVGIEGVALSEIAYQTALKWAKDRRQSRSLDPEKRDEDADADPIMVHPDVRRMFADIKATTEGMRGMATWAAINLDLAENHPDDDKRQEADDLVAALTPLIKAYCTKRGFENVDTAMQACGGSGYTTDMHIEQYMRDLRIAKLYEGTNHIQALDLVGRKLPKDNGRIYRTFQTKVTELIKETDGIDELEEFVDPLKSISEQLTEITMKIGAQAEQDPEQAGAVANNYLELFALTAISYCWITQLRYAIENDTDNVEEKKKTARYFFNMILPKRHTLAEKIERGKEYMMDFEVDEF
jgi:alkylation response protein AidB-like acyl-CoA dehydrogenase